MRLSLTSLASLTLVAALAAGCQKAGEPTEQTSDNPEQLSPQQGPEQAAKPDKRGKRGKFGKRGHHDMFRGGMAGTLLHTATSKLELTADKKAELEKLSEKLRGGSERDAHKAFQEALVEAVKSGTVSDAKFETHYAALDKAAQARHDQQVEVLSELHAALDVDQRKALVAAVRERGEKGGKMRGDKARGDKARGDMAMDHKGPGARGPRGDKMRGMKFHGGSERLAKDLGLDDAQRQKLDTALAALPEHKKDADWSAKREEMKKQKEALLTAFEQDNFDAKAALPAAPAKGREMAQMQVKRISAIVSVLSDEQRTKFAERMNRRGGHSRKGPPGAGGPAAEPPSPEDMPEAEDESEL